MKNLSEFSEYGISVPEILLPAKKDLASWSVIACDQFTQDRDYWKKVEDAVGDKPSTLRMILPEVYLEDGDREERIAKIRSVMKDYLSGGVFDEPQKEFIYIERKTAYSRTRRGLVCAVDLESYEWERDSKALIRATEATIASRIPPRMEIRSGAPIESPHIMLLVNDPQKKLVEAAGERAKKNPPVYDGDLMLDSGSIKGWAVKDEESLAAVKSALADLKEAGKCEDGSHFLFAVGDGNHSLATAKAVWDEYKEELKKEGRSEDEIASSPVRYALAEIVNIYDEGLTFETIHRVLLDVCAPEIMAYLCATLGAVITDCDSFEELEKSVKETESSFGIVGTSIGGKTGYHLLRVPGRGLLVSRIQPLLDSFLLTDDSLLMGSEIDYIHGSDEVLRLGKKEQCVTLLLPPIDKSCFFETISSRGPLPRKSFSMGEASEKRFYLECRRLFES